MWARSVRDGSTIRLYGRAGVRTVVHRTQRSARCSIAAVTSPSPVLVLYSRPGCHLCEATHEALELLLAERRAQGRTSPPIVERDIESDPDLHRSMLELIPVVEVGDRRLDLATSVAKLRRFLAETLDAGAPPE
jgi:glutaredoxin